jgi:hypothetical protein
MAKKKAPSNWLYLKSDTGRHHRVMWFRNTKADEMIFGLAGHAAHVGAVLTWIFPEHDTTEQDGSITYLWDEAERADLRLDHFTCHADGTFHLKSRAGTPIYSQTIRRCEPLGPRTSCFLHFQAVLDVPEYYPTDNKMGSRDAWIEIPAGTRTVIEGMFSGISHPVETEMARRMTALGVLQPRVRLIGRTIKGVVAPTHAFQTNERPGTILSFRLTTTDGRTSFKTFCFE